MYNIKSIKKLDKSNCELITNNSTIYCIHVQIIDVNKVAKNIIELLEDKCWIKDLLDEDDLESYQKRGKPTVKHIWNKVNRRKNLALC